MAGHVGYRAQTRERDFADRGRFLEYLRLLLRLSKVHNKRVLDIGCGFGWHDVGLSLLDPTVEIVGLDILPGMIEGMNECLASLRRSGLTVRVSAMCGDICNLDLETGSFGAIFSNESIEHVHDVEKMIASCHRLLQPGGKLIISNDQNALHKPTREHTIAMWEKRERSREWSDYLRSLRPVEHAEAKPFIEVRSEIIRETDPTLDVRKVNFLAERTAGLLKADIERVTRDPSTWKSLPSVPAFDRCRNPLTGEYAERLLTRSILPARSKRPASR